jgi:signal transduction histidine kinase
MRTDALILESEREVAQQIAATWLADGIDARRSMEVPIPIRFVAIRDGVNSASDGEPFVQSSIAAFLSDAALQDRFEEDREPSGRVYRYARAIRHADRVAGTRIDLARFGSLTIDPTAPETLEGVLIIERSSAFAAEQLLLNRVFIAVTGLIAAVLAMVAFWLILTRLILSPVRRLRDTAEKVQGGDLSIRSHIATGDDFEQLSSAFNQMLDRLQTGQERLRSVNEALDLKVGQLAEANVGLDASNRIKTEFVANISHELRTPLNSIIGFAELLDELARNDPHADPKRVRYITNILSSGRSLLELINDLLTLARLDSGRMEVHIEQVVIGEVIEGLRTIMRPQAEARRIAIEARIPSGLPPVSTDPGKLQQILFNFLSNAMKFSPEGGTVVIAAELIARDDDSSGVRISVIDQGPGIPPDQQDNVFQRFQQLDGSHTRKHSGTGLGLAICRDLSELLGARLNLVSRSGMGASFTVELPLVYRERDLQPLMG